MKFCLETDKERKDSVQHTCKNEYHTDKADLTHLSVGIEIYSGMH